MQIKAGALNVLNVPAEEQLQKLPMCKRTFYILNDAFIDKIPIGYMAEYAVINMPARIRIAMLYAIIGSMSDRVVQKHRETVSVHANS